MLIEVPPIELISKRLPLIFPPGTEHRNFVIREMAARTIFVMFYAGAAEGTERYIRPSQVTDMADSQAQLLDDESRIAWANLSLSKKKKRPADAWYAPNSREPVRDETLRSGLIPFRAVLEREGLATTSQSPKYFLNRAFANLFSPALCDDAFADAVVDWQGKHLSKAAISRMRLVKHGASVALDAINITFPNGEIRALKPGPSSIIAKAVIEVFSLAFLKRPAVLWLSESGNKVVARDETLAGLLELKIDASKALPDIILVDMGSDLNGTEMMVVFVEVVATDGPITRARKAVLESIAVEAGFEPRSLAFLTAFQDRDHSSFKKCISALAWGSLAWCSSEPEHIIDLRDSRMRKLSDMRFDT